MSCITLSIGPTLNPTKVTGDAMPLPTILTLGGPATFTLADGTIAGIEIDGVTFTSDVDGQPLMTAALTAGPICLARPVIDLDALTVGDIIGFERGIWIFDADGGLPVMSQEWYLDGATTLITSAGLTTVAPGSLTVQETATQASLGSRTAVSTASTVAAVTPTRTVADVIADHGGDYFDFADLSHMYQDSGSTLVDTDGQNVTQVNGQAGAIILEAVAGGSGVTYDDTFGGLDFDGASRGLRTNSLAIGAGFTTVARVNFDDVSGNQPVAHYLSSAGSRVFEMRLNGGDLQTAAFNAADASTYNNHNVIVPIGVPQTIASRADEVSGEVIGQVDGANRSTTSLALPLAAFANERITIGWRAATYLDGQISRLVLIPVGSVSDHDLTILEEWVGAA
ncbi:hypothetical protein L0666_16890 [Octadecabacter sp. CECT 8868]|uniref:hypothetical protein n=1 Tax=Octadecabacter algicola TaxID=2909342 RepID=UPI001F367510|nr:hypothetical protein [Octadecabacter algicola]MCF2906673.1 hypothetical protein [Octadecabacter algicola]